MATTYENKTLVRGETLHIYVTLTSEGEPVSGILLENMVSDARFPDGRRVPLTITEVKDEEEQPVAGKYELHSDVDTNTLKGDTFEVNIAISNYRNVQIGGSTTATLNKTFYIADSATDLSRERLIGR